MRQRRLERLDVVERQDRDGGVEASLALLEVEQRDGSHARVRGARGVDRDDLVAGAGQLGGELALPRADLEDARGRSGQRRADEREHVGGAHHGSPQGSTTAFSALPSRWAASAAPVSSSPKRCVTSPSTLTAPDRSSASAARQSAAPDDQDEVTVSSRRKISAPSTAIGAPGLRRGVGAEPPARPERRGGCRDRLRVMRGDDRHVDRLAGRERGGAPLERALAPVRARLGDEHPLDAAGVRRADVQQAARPRADHEQHVARGQPDAILGAQGAGERLGARGGDGIEAVERQQVGDELGLDAHVLGEAAGVQPRGAELRAERLVPGGAHAAGAAGDVVVDRDDVAGRDARDPGAHLDDLADRLVPEHGRQLARHVPAVDVRTAGRGRDDAADHLARPASQVREGRQ